MYMWFKFYKKIRHEKTLKHLDYINNLTKIGIDK